MAHWIDAVLADLPTDNAPPQALGRTVTTRVLPNAGPVEIALADLAKDPDVGDTLTFGVPHPMTTLGGRILVDNQTGVTFYTPPANVGTDITDSFVYTVTDSNGGVGHNVVLVPLGWQ